MLHLKSEQVSHRERMDEALLASMQNAAESLRGDAATAGPDLAEARDAVEARIEQLRARAELHSMLGTDDRMTLLVELASHRRLVTVLLAIEQWLAGWRAATAPEPGAAPVHPGPREAVG